MLIRSPTDLAAPDPEFQNALKAHWGRDNCIVWGQARHADFGPFTHPLSIRAVWSGVEYCHVDGRTLGVDCDNFLILNHGRIYSTSIRSAQPVESLAICFRSELVESIHGAAAASAEEALERGDTFEARSSDFFEHLQPHEATISPMLRLIREHLLRGFDEQAWYDEQLVDLLARMRSHREQLLARVDGLALMRATTRREVYRRIARATDLLHTNYAQGVDLDTLAKVAALSKYHCLRLFKLVHGVTPHTYLQRKRIGAAVRLLESTRLTVREVASSVGFADDSTLARQMRRWMRLTPGQVRAATLKSDAA
jgi:AraC family transcriptional regulator